MRPNTCGDAEHEVLTKRVAYANVALASVEARLRDIGKQFHVLKETAIPSSNHRFEVHARGWYSRSPTRATAHTIALGAQYVDRDYVQDFSSY